VATASSTGYADGRLELNFDHPHEQKLALIALKTAPPSGHHKQPHPGAPPPPTEHKTPGTGITIDKSNPFK
jgi:hypothetical protein